MKPESQVIVYHYGTVNMYSGPAQTARHALGVRCTLSNDTHERFNSFMLLNYNSVACNWGEVVTR